MKTCFLALTLILASTCFAGDISWQVIGKSSDKKAIMSIDPQSIAVTHPDVVHVLVKKELSEEMIAALKEGFDESVQKAGKETGTKVDDPEEVFRIYIKNEKQPRTIYYIFSCKDNTYSTRTGGNITFVYPVPAAGAEKDIKEIVCKEAEKEREKAEKDRSESGKGSSEASKK